MLESLSINDHVSMIEASSESFRSGILDDWPGSNVNCNPVIIFRCCMAVQLELEATSYSSVRETYEMVGVH